MNENKEYQLYEIVMLGLKLTKSTLEAYSFTNEDIDKLIKDRIIMEESENAYKLISVEKMYMYGVKLLVNYEVRRANNCFYKCHKIDSYHRKACLQIFLSNLKKRDYNKLLNNFIELANINSEEYQKDNALYLYLLSMIISIPQEYQEKINNICVDDIIDIKENTEEEINIRYNILLNKFTYALKLLNNLVTKRPIYSVENEVLKELLSQVSDMEREFKMNLYNSAKMGNYQNIISALKYKAKKRSLKNNEEYILLVAKAIIRMLETGRIPIPTTYHVQGIYQALKGNNFPLALKLNNSFIEKNDKKKEEEILNILLLKINDLIILFSTDKANQVESSIMLDTKSKKLPPVRKRKRNYQ